MKKIEIEHFFVKKPFSPMTFLILSDLHNCISDPIIKTIGDLPFDAVLIPGDLFESPPRREEFRFKNILPLLHTLSEKAPIFYVRGNHDKTFPKELESLFQRPEFHELSYTQETMGPITLGGYPSNNYSKDHPLEHKEFWDAFRSNDNFRILLDHHPEHFKDLPRDSFDLMIAGHAHGGQWRIGHQGIFAPGQGIFPKYTSGLYENQLLVSRGLAESKGIPRFFNSREILFLTIGNIDNSAFKDI